MPIKNLYLVENKKPTELVQELEKYEIKKSPLSLSARGKVINKSGSGYVSENKNDYGPGSAQSNYSDNSDKTKMERYYGKATVGTASSIASKVVTPIVPAVAGVVTTAVSEIGHALSSDSDTKDAWKYASELGQDMMTGFVVGNFVDNLRLPYGLKKG
jgi:hypothetical protein